MNAIIFFSVIVVGVANSAIVPSAAVSCDGTKVDYNLRTFQANLTDYRYVEIHAKLPNFCTDLAKSLSHTTEINAESVGLKSFDDGALNRLADVKLFSAKNNALMSLRRHEFHGTSLNRINLSKNKLTTIVAETFAELPHLDTINLSGNEIATLEKDWFVDCDRLSQLTLFENRIKLIDDAMFANLNPSLSFAVKLGGNEIETIESGAFGKMRQIDELTLHKNQLKEFDSAFLKDAEFVSILDLGVNRLRCINADIADKCAMVFLAGNDFDDECIGKLRKVTADKQKRLFL